LDVWEGGRREGGGGKKIHPIFYIYILQYNFTELYNELYIEYIIYYPNYPNYPYGLIIY
jgi:hypothetical protein